MNLHLILKDCGVKIVNKQTNLSHISHPEIIYSSTFWEHPYAEEIYSKVECALHFFPEITFPIKLSRHGTKGSNFAIAFVRVIGEPEISFNINFHSSMVTIFHELGHILQHFTDFDIPYGEEAASIFALSRMPDYLIDSDRIPYVGLVPCHRVGDYCRKALEQRKIQRNYIKWLKTQISIDYDSDTWPKEDIFNIYINETEKSSQEQLNI